MLERRQIVFDADAHTYTDEYSIKYTSTTTVIGKYEPEFNIPYWSMYRVLDQDGYRPRPLLESNQIEILFSGKRQAYSLDAFYAGLVPTSKSPEDIQREWGFIKDEACIWGSNKHSYLEDCILAFANTREATFNELIDKIERPQFEGFNAEFVIHNQAELDVSPLKFIYPSIYDYLCKVIRNGWTIYVEVRLYDAYYKLAGTADIILVKGKQFMVLDWKTNKKEMKFIAGYYKKAWNNDRSKKVETGEWVNTRDSFKHPLAHLPHAKGIGYTLQLSTYAFILERWGYECTGLLLCHIKPVLLTDGTIVKDASGMRVEEPPRWYPLEYLKNDVQLMLEHNLHNS